MISKVISTGLYVISIRAVSVLHELCGFYWMYVLHWVYGWLEKDSGLIKALLTGAVHFARG